MFVKSSSLRLGFVDFGKWLIARYDFQVNANSLESMQLQPMRDKDLEIGGIGGGEFCAGEDGRGGDDGVEPGAAFRAGGIKQLASEFCGLCIEREDAAGEKTLHGMAQQRGGRGSGMKFHPYHCGTAKVIVTGQNKTGCLMMGVGHVLRSNQEIGVQMDHTE